MLRENYFDPAQFRADGPGAICRGAMTQDIIKPGPGFVDATQHHLFKPFGMDHGVDLFTINIIRGRDHGLASYTKYREACEADPVFSTYYDSSDWDGMYDRKGFEMKNIFTYQIRAH